MKNKKFITLLFLGLILTGCSGREVVDDEIEDVYIDESSSTVEESTSYDNEEFYAPLESTTSQSTAENTEATEQTKETTEESKGKLEVVKTNNGNFKVDLTSGWQKTTAKELSDNADVSLKNEARQAYYMVLSQSKDDFEDFESFKATIDLSDLGEISNEKKEEIDYNTLTGERRTFTAKKEDVEVYYIYDLMEGSDHYLQCISWTLNSDKKKNETELTKLMESLVEIPE
ncbi:hypothetical protein GIX45_23655 [Erwinia sp. CPCC 100877]|nr:hypothetical protein [Erwinia sp. CPCC 100877]